MQELYTQSASTTASASSSVEISKVLRNTYALLAMTLLFSALCAAGSMAIGIGYGASLAMSFGALALVWFVLPRTANSATGIWVVFAFTGLLGAGLGPVLSYYLALNNGSLIIAQAMGGTALIFFGLSGYALVSRKDFSFMTGFLITGIIVAFVAGIANMFLQIQGLALAVSSMFLVLSSLLIMWQTSQIIHGGERNYIMATATLYVSIYNVFTSLLHILGIMNNE